MTRVIITKLNGSSIEYEGEDIEYGVNNAGLIILSAKVRPATVNGPWRYDFAIINPASIERIDFERPQTKQEKVCD